MAGTLAAAVACAPLALRNGADELTAGILIAGLMLGNAIGRRIISGAGSRRCPGIVLNAFDVCGFGKSIPRGFGCSGRT